jgi:hypothetical protein
MPLNIEVEQEHPDVTALKEQVREVAQKYARRHNWCAEVNRALAEAGIIDPRPKKMSVEILFTVGDSEEQRAIKRFPLADLAGKTPEEQNAWVAEQITPKVEVAGVEVTSLNVMVRDLNEVTRAARSGLEYPTGYVHFYTSNDGRVAHLMEDPGVEVTDGWLQRNGRYALCTQVAYLAVTESARSEGRVCPHCLARAESARGVGTR